MELSPEEEEEHRVPPHHGEDVQQEGANLLFKRVCHLELISCGKLGVSQGLSTGNRGGQYLRFGAETILENPTVSFIGIYASCPDTTLCIC